MRGAAIADDSLVRHDIAVGNILYGSAHFITLRLPEVWEIAPGVGRPEIVAVHERNQRKWIVSGQAWYVVFHRELGWVMELMLESRTRRKLKVHGPGESIEVYGHQAQVRRWQRRRGIFRPRTITFVEVTYNCESSDRLLRLELSGRCPPEGFEQMLALLTKWWCH